MLAIREKLAKCRDTSVMDLTINEFYGQTEVNLVVGNWAEIMQVRRGSMGKAIPGHRVEVIDEEGNVVPPGTVGEVAILRPEPLMFLKYWRNPEATKDKFIGDWACTGGDQIRKRASHDGNGKDHAEGIEEDGSRKESHE